MTIKFQNPPINELVIATYFNPPIPGLRNEHVGIFWSRIKDDFPESSQQIPTGGPEQIMDIKNEMSPMPRYCFISKDGVNALQVQKNAFMLNWRRQDADYPRFNAYLKPAFDKYFSIFYDFVLACTVASEVAIDLCQLTYINLIRCCEFWSGPEDTRNVIPSFSVPDPGVAFQGPPAFNCGYIFDVAPDLQLVVTVRNAVMPREPDESEPVLIMEIQASGRLGKASKLETGPWFDRAHESINQCFIGITNPQIQRQHWMLEEENL